MTTQVILTNTSAVHSKLHHYRAWLIKNLMVPGEPRSWAWKTTADDNKTIVYNVIEFRDEEDAMAFKLTFGL